jgi:hypothetical protein
VDQDKIQPPEQLSQALQRLLCGGGAPFFECVGLQVPFPAAPGTPSSHNFLQLNQNKTEVVIVGAKVRREILAVQFNSRAIKIKPQVKN